MKIDFNQAIITHLGWRVRVKSFLDGGRDIDEAQAIDYKNCDAGRWLYSESMAEYGKFPEVNELKKIHVELHVLVRIITEMKRGGDERGARQRFTEFNAVCDRFVELIKLVKKKIKIR